MIKIEFTPHRAALLQGHANTLDVLLRAKAPDAPKNEIKRSLLNLSLVIDRSGSMNGQPLDEAKRCAAMVVDRLSAQDRLSIVTYDHSVDVIVPSTSVENKDMILNALKSIMPGGRTALHDGWLAGAEQAARYHDGEFLSRVLLLSDGCANVGLTDAGPISDHCTEMAEAGVGTSTYGLSTHFNEELMMAMASSGLGNSYYGQTAEDLMDPFQEEFDLLQSLCARKLRLSLSPADGVSVQVLNRYRTDHGGNHMLPDLAYGAEAWALIRLGVPRESLGSDDKPLLVLQADLAFEDINGEAGQDTTKLFLPPLPASAFEAVATDDVVASRAAELRAADLQEQARTAARAGDWAQVDELIIQLEDVGKDSPWLSNSIKSLSRYAAGRRSRAFSKEALYKSSKMRSRLAASDASERTFSRDAEMGKASYLRRKSEQGKRFERRDEHK